MADLSVFTVMLLTMMTGFAIAGMNIFGQESNSYIDFERSFTTLFLMILGEFDFEEMYEINPSFAYGFFMFYQFFIFLIMVNIFLAILNDAYIAVKEKHDAMPKGDGPPPLSFKQRARNAMAWFRQRTLDRRVEKLRKAQRLVSLREKRAQRQVMQKREKTMKSMGLASSILGTSGESAAAKLMEAAAAADRDAAVELREDP